MRTLVLMAGPDDVFVQAGYQYPKNLAEIDGEPLVQRVLEWLSPLREACTKFIVCLRADEVRRFQTDATVRLLAPEAVVVNVPSGTAGAACTALLAIEWIESDEPLVIVNGDIVLRVDLQAAIKWFGDRELDGGALVFESVHPRWSFVRVDKTGHVIEAAEKKPISRLATAGVYYYAQGRAFVRAAMSMIRKDVKHDERFYICPAFNEMILEQARIGVYPIPRDAYFSLKGPHDVLAYEEFLRSARKEERRGRGPTDEIPR